MIRIGLPKHRSDHLFWYDCRFVDYLFVCERGGQTYVWKVDALGRRPRGWPRLSVCRELTPYQADYVRDLRETYNIPVDGASCRAWCPERSLGTRSAGMVSAPGLYARHSIGEHMGTAESS